MREVGIIVGRRLGVIGVVVTGRKVGVPKTTVGLTDGVKPTEKPEPVITLFNAPETVIVPPQY